MRDICIDAGVNLVRLAPDDMQNVLNFVKQFNLDFDDAYQYAAAELLGLQIVSFDHHFDTTPRGRKMPGEIAA